MRRPGISTSRPNGYVARSTVWPSDVSARMRWNSENAVPRGSNNGSGAIIKMCMRWRPDRAGESKEGTCYTTPRAAAGDTPRYIDDRSAQDYPHNIPSTTAGARRAAGAAVGAQDPRERRPDVLAAPRRRLREAVGHRASRVVLLVPGGARHLFRDGTGQRV